MCQSREMGGLRCTGHIQGNIDSNNADFNDLVVEKLEANGHPDISKKYKEDAKEQADKLASVDPKYLKKQQEVDVQRQISANFKKKVKDALNKDNAKVEVTSVLANADPKYTVLRITRDMMAAKHIVKTDDHGNVTFVGSVSEKEEFEKARSSMMEIEDRYAKEASELVESHAQDKDKFTKSFERHYLNYASADEEAEYTYNKVRSNHYFQSYNKNVESNPDYVAFSNEVEESDDPRFKTINARREKLASQYYLTRDSEAELEARSRIAFKNNDRQEATRLLAEVQDLKMKRAKYQYDIVKTTPKASSRREGVMKMHKHDYNVAKKQRNTIIKLAKKPEKTW